MMWPCILPEALWMHPLNPTAIPQHVAFCALLDSHQIIRTIFARKAKWWAWLVNSLKGVHSFLGWRRANYCTISCTSTCACGNLLPDSTPHVCAMPSYGVCVCAYVVWGCFYLEQVWQRSCGKIIVIIIVAVATVYAIVFAKHYHTWVCVCAPLLLCFWKSNHIRDS